MPDPLPVNQELAALKAEFDELREQNAELHGEVQALKQDQPAQQPAAPSVGRRGLLAGGGVGALALLASMGGASAATDPNDGDADLGTSANPWDTYLNGLALNVADVSTATTVTDPVVRYDPSVSGFTATIGSDLEGPSGYSQPVVLQEVGGSSNAVTVDTQSANGINGGASISLSQPYATTVLYWTGSEWRTDWFTQSVDAGTVAAGEIGNGGSPITQGDVFSRDGISKGSTTESYQAESSDGSGVRVGSQPTDGVSTSATAIYQFGGSGARAVLLTVVGVQQGGDNGLFTDVVHVGRSTGTTTVLNSEEGNTPAARTYTIDTAADALDLAMAADTYDVAVEGTQVQVA